MQAGRHKRNCGSGGGAPLRALIAVGLAATLVSCVSAPPKKQSSVDYSKRIRRLEVQLKKKNQVIEDLRERNLVLEQRQVVNAANPPPTGVMVVEPDPADAEAATAPPAPATPEAKTLKPEKEAPAAQTALPAGENGDHILYSKIIDTYRSHNSEEMKRTLGLLLKTYPDSIFADNALYTAGLQAFELNDLQGARAFFQRVITEYPRSNKVVSALFLTAQIDKRLGHASEAARGFKKVRDLFPGSPEAFRVSVELKLLGPTTSKLRES